MRAVGIFTGINGGETSSTSYREEPSANAASNEETAEKGRDALVEGGSVDGDGDSSWELSPWIYAGVCVLALLAFALFALTGYVESKLAESGERQAIALVQRSARYAGDQLLEAGPAQPCVSLAGDPCLFDARDGGVAVSPAEGAPAPVGSSVYELVRQASLAQTDRAAFSDASEYARARADAEVARVQAMVLRGEPALTVGVVDGRKSYVVLAPTGVGSWWVCEVVPVSAVRAEVDVVSAIFAVVFLLSVVGVILAGTVAAYLYRKRAREREVEMKTHLYAALSDSLDLSVCLYSPADGGVTSVVAEGASGGADFADFICSPVAPPDLSLPEDAAAFLDRVRVGNVAGLERLEIAFREPAGGIARCAEITARPLTFEGKDQVLVAVRDVTSEKRIELSMRDAMEAAESANRAKSEFLSHMSHDIRTPLNVIVGMASIARSSIGDRAKLERCLARIEGASAHLLELVNEVLDLSKIESGKADSVNVPFRLVDIASSIGDLIEPQCKSKGQTYSCRLSGAVDTVFAGDPARVKRMLVNLLTNAVKYTDEGGHVSLSIAVAPALSPGYRRITFVVSDDGIGMSKDYLAHLFEPFAMEGRSSSQGTGLGMSIVKSIVNAAGGDIHVETEVGRGTTFTIVMNRRVAQSAGGAARGAAGRSATRAPSADEERAHAPRRLAARVLLVEDNELNAEIARELLQERGMKVDWARGGEEALERLGAEGASSYDAVLMDVRMPVMNGYDATRAIRALEDPAARDIPIVAMSANAFADDVLASLKSGMNAHLSKPIDVDEVVATLAREIAAQGCSTSSHALY